MPSATDVLNLRLGDHGNDADAVTVREYLIALLRKLWVEEEGFSGKRPFGNSGWQYDLYDPMVKAGWIPGDIDDDGYVETLDQAAADNLIIMAIDELGRV